MSLRWRFLICSLLPVFLSNCSRLLSYLAPSCYMRLHRRTIFNPGRADSHWHYEDRSFLLLLPWAISFLRLRSAPQDNNDSGCFSTCLLGVLIRLSSELVLPPSQPPLPASFYRCSSWLSSWCLSLLFSRISLTSRMVRSVSATQNRIVSPSFSHHTSMTWFRFSSSVLSCCPQTFRYSWALPIKIPTSFVTHKLSSFDRPLAGFPHKHIPCSIDTTALPCFS